MVAQQDTPLPGLRKSSVLLHWKKRAPPDGTETTQLGSAVRNLLSPSAHFDPTLLHFRMDENKLYVLKILFPLPTLVGFSYHVGLGGQD